MKNKQTIIVQKFGGSSVATLAHIKSVAKFIKNTKGNNNIIVVVSAMGKTTNELHNKAHTLCSLPNLRELDQLLSIGELQSVALLSIEVNRLVIPAISMSGTQAGITTNSGFGNAHIIDINPKNIAKQLALGKVVVVAGFQGVDANGNITTLGRGGSDTTAVALASIFKAKCEIYSDINCIYSCDPRYHQSKLPLHRLDYDTMLEMSFNGTKAMEVRAVELAKKYNVEIYTGKSLRKNKMKGTIIKNITEQFENVKIINLSVCDNMQFIKLTSLNDNEKLNLFSYFGQNALNYKMFNFHTMKNKTIYSFCLDNNTFLNNKKHLLKCGSLKNICGGIITLVGSGFATHPILVSKIMQLLDENNIKIIALEIRELAFCAFIAKDNIDKCVKLFAKNFKL